MKRQRNYLMLTLVSKAKGQKAKGQVLGLAIFRCVRFLWVGIPHPSSLNNPEMSSNIFLNESSNKCARYGKI